MRISYFWLMLPQQHKTFYSWNGITWFKVRWEIMNFLRHIYFTIGRQEKINSKIYYANLVQVHEKRERQILILQSFKHKALVLIFVFFVNFWIELNHMTISDFSKWNDKFSLTWIICIQWSWGWVNTTKPKTV